MDPIFSAGVFLAMWSGKLAAETVQSAIAAGKPGGRRFAKYEKRVRKGMTYYWRMVENFYTTPFMELFLRPTERYNLFSAVIGVLAGEVEGSWALRWRVQLFYFFETRRIGRCRASFSPRCHRDSKALNRPAFFSRQRGNARGPALVTLSAGCRTGRPCRPPISPPGWRVQQGQAVWKRQHRPELPENSFGYQPSGFLRQFSKPPSRWRPRRSDGEWQIEFGSGNVARCGQPPTRFAWFQLPESLAGEREEFRPVADSWRLENLHRANHWRVASSHEWTSSSLARKPARELQHRLRAQGPA
jgi:hypothetical protein